MQLSAKVYRACLAAMAAVWVTLLFIAYQPGLMSPDSLGQYAEGVTGNYTELYPPFISWLYGLAGRAAGSPWPVLLLQLAALSGGIAALLWRLPPSRRFAGLLLFATYLLVPSNWSIGVTLWKDTLMTTGLLLAVVAIAGRRPVLAVTCLAVACMARYNALIAALPLALAAMGFARARWVQAGLAVVTLCALASLPKVLTWTLHPKPLCMSCPIPAHDLVGIYAERPELLERSVLAQHLSAEDIRHSYNPTDVIPLLFDVGQGGRHVDLETLTGKRDEILAEWWAVVRQNPGLYARNRLRMFRALLGLDLKPVFYPYHFRLDPNVFGLELRAHTALHRALRQTQDALKNTLAFRGWFWLLLISSLGAVSLAARGRPTLTFWVALSAALYMASFLVSSNACDFRYHYWSVVSAFAAMALLLHSGSGEDPGDSTRRATGAQRSFSAQS